MDRMDIEPLKAQAMDINIQLGSPDDASDYSFSNFYFHPDFFSDQADPTIKQVFSGPAPGASQTIVAAEKDEEKQSDKKD